MGGSSPPSAPAAPQSWGGQANYIPQNQQAADTTYSNLLQQSGTTASNLQAQGTPIVSAALNSIASNPYAAGLVPAALNAQQYANTTVTPGEQAGAAALQNYASSAMPLAQQALQAGFDPQQSLYNQQYQQMLDQQNAINAMSGVSGSAYGAGVTGQQAQNFNTSWEANQQARQAAGAATANNILAGAGDSYTGAAQLGNQAIQGTVGAAALPYAAGNTPAQTDLSAVGTAGQAMQSIMQPSTAQESAAGNYLGLGTSASQQINNAINQNYQSQLAAYQAQQQASSSMMSGLGSLGGSLFGASGIFGNGTGGGAGAGLFSNLPGMSSLSGLFGGGAAAGGAAAGGDAAAGGAAASGGEALASMAPLLALA